MRSPTISQILDQLVELRERLPADRAGPLRPESTWLLPAARDERLQWALAQAGAILIEIDQDARVLYVSPNVAGVLGYRPDQFLGLYVGDHVHPDDLARLVDVSRAMGDGSAPDRPTLRARHADGRWVHLEAVSAARFRASDGSIHSVTVLCDVSERHRAWAALRESEERYRVIAETSRDAIVEIDERRRTTFQTAMVRELLGYTPEQLEGMPPLGLMHPDDRPRVEQQLRHAFYSGETVAIEPFRMRRVDDRWIWYESTGLTYTRADGSRRFLAVGRDVTERLRQEEERRALETRVQQSQRLESLGMLAGGIAHDFNNLLTPILGEARLALLDLPPDSPMRLRFERIQRAAQRAADLTRQMLAHAGAETPRFGPVDLSPLVDEMARLVDRSTADGVELRFELADGLPPVQGDAAQLGQVVSNLVTNALESMEGRRGAVVVRTGRVDLREPADCGAHGFDSPLAPGDYVFVEVEDGGCGMDEATLARIFDPFFTSKFTGRGLGLAAVHGILRGHEAGVEIDTEPDRGTRFRVLLPARARAGAASAAASGGSRGA